MTASTPSDAVIDSVAELFSLLSTPVRLKIIHALCTGEKNVSQLLAEIDTTQPNMSQHLSTLYRAGVLGKRRDSTQIYYRLESDRVASLCNAMCAQVASEMAPVQRVAAAKTTAKAAPVAKAAKAKPRVAAQVPVVAPRANARAKARATAR